ncbi:Morphogenesis-related protein MSB1 [Spathaspora sp. JA1]|nr:Morphogenesis-related protein MSB1 [Spathaspora sp. JA1]
MTIKKLPNLANLELPKLPNEKKSHGSSSTSIEAGIIPAEQFSRNNLKSILHIITQELKKRGTKTPYIFLPFRSRVNDSSLEKLLAFLFPNGEVIDCTNEKKVEGRLYEFDEFTLICGLKYLWARLPNNEVIGWDVYLEFKRKEAEKGYPKNAFLAIMPKCLSSPAHASIVYDFLDLILSITSNSQENYLSGRKISKMASFWAFNPIHNKKPQEFDFNDGVEMWNKSTNALFHLVLSFLRSMLPETDMETLKLPKSLQSLLVTNQYPPVEELGQSLRNMITIPCVSINSTRQSKNAYELISKVRYSLSFEKKDSFLSVENYTILKKLFNKKATSEIVETLTEESRRILSRITADPIDSQYKLQPGWAKSLVEFDDDIPQYSKIEISNVSIQDYYIWTWLSSLGSDQTSHMKRLFGRSIVVEADILGFQKWIVISEKTMSSEEYLRNFNLDKVSNSSADKKLPLPPLPDASRDSSRPSSEETEKDFSDEFSYIYNSSLITVDSESVEDDYRASSKELSNVNQQLSKLALSEIVQPKKPPRTRKAPPASFEYNKTRPLSELETSNKNVEKSPEKNKEFLEPFDEYHTERERRNKLKEQKLNSEPFDNYHVGKVSSSSSTSESDQPTLQLEEKEDDIEEAKKLERRAQKAQLAAAKAAGFPFAFLPSNEPPPPPEKAAETARVVSDLMMNSPFLVTIPGSEAVLVSSSRNASKSRSPDRSSAKNDSERDSSVSPTRVSRNTRESPESNRVRRSPVHKDLTDGVYHKESNMKPLPIPEEPVHNSRHMKEERSYDKYDKELPPIADTTTLTPTQSLSREAGTTNLSGFVENEPLVKGYSEERTSPEHNSPVRKTLEHSHHHHHSSGHSSHSSEKSIPQESTTPQQQHGHPQQTIRNLAKSPMLQSVQPNFQGPPPKSASPRIGYPQGFDGHQQGPHPAMTPQPAPLMGPPRILPGTSPQRGPGYYQQPFPPQQYGSPRQQYGSPRQQYPPQFAQNSPQQYGPPQQQYPQQYSPHYPAGAPPQQQYPFPQMYPQQFPHPHGYGPPGGVPGYGNLRSATPRGKFNDMTGVPVVAKHNKNVAENKASLRSAFVQGNFGI